MEIEADFFNRIGRQLFFMKGCHGSMAVRLEPLFSTQSHLSTEGCCRRMPAGNNV
ncbi:hypothetical protein C4J89_4578 [Pseudomonas sp. R4-35-07]|nr:hypothetical protein C4J89_4578 [Pseudomonas sp. R4-35-07]